MLADVLPNIGVALATSYVLHGLFYILLLVVSSAITSQIFFNARRLSKQPRGSYKHQGVETSNLADQYDAIYNGTGESTPNDKIRVKALYIHPIKSCRYIEVDQAKLTKTGFEYDRCFTFATGSKGSTNPSEWKMASQRTKPLMTHVEVEIWLPDGKQSQSNGSLVVSFPDPGVASLTSRLETFFTTWSLSQKPKVQFVVPLQPTPTEIQEHGLKLRRFTIHNREAKGLDMIGVPSFAAALPKLKQLLKISNREDLTLLRWTPETLSRTQQDLAPLENIGSRSMHGYTDEQPVNINSLSSIHAISALLPEENQPLNALRYRANIWVTGAPAFAEDRWKRVKIIPRDEEARGSKTIPPVLSVVCRTARCTMPDVDPDKGTFTRQQPPPGRSMGKSQPSATLIEYRMVETGNPAALGYLGVHCVPEDSTLNIGSKEGDGAYISVGDEIEVMETGVHMQGATANDY